MASVAIKDSGAVAGVWVTADNGSCVGLVACTDKAYLCVYPNVNKSGKYLPFAIAAEAGESEAVVQIPGPNGDMHATRVLTLSQIVEAVAKL